MQIRNLLNLNLSNSQINRVFKNISSQITLNFINTLSQLIFPPLMIIIFGIEKFGFWIFLLSIPSLIGFFNISEAARIEMSINYNKKKKSEVQKIFINSNFLTSFITLLFVFISLIFLKFYHLDNKFIEEIDFKFLIFFIFTSFYLNFLFSILRNGILYKGILYIDTYIQSFFDIFSKVLILILGFYTQNLLYAGLALFVSNVIQSCVLYYFFTINNENLKLFSLKLFSKKEIFRILKLSIPHYISTLNVLLKNSVLIILLGSFFNYQLVGFVSTLKTLFYFLPIKFLDVIGKSFNYELTKFYSEGKKILLKKLFVKLMKFISFIIILYLFLSLTLGKIIYEIWTNYSYEFNNLVYILLIFETSLFISSYYVKIIQIYINKFFNLSIIELLVNLTVIIISYLSFLNGINFTIIFVLNLVASFILMFYNYYDTKKIFID